jgi:hypothetical protein
MSTSKGLEESFSSDPTTFLTEIDNQQLASALPMWTATSPVKNCEYIMLRRELNSDEWGAGPTYLAVTAKPTPVIGIYAAPN